MTMDDDLERIVDRCESHIAEFGVASIDMDILNVYAQTRQAISLERIADSLDVIKQLVVEEIDDKNYGSVEDD